MSGNLPEEYAGETREQLIKAVGELKVQLAARERELDDSRNRCLGLYDYAPLAYVTLDKQGTICGANLTASCLLGMDRDTLIGGSMLDVVAASDRTKLFDHLARCQTQAQATSELKLQVPDGTIVLVHLTSTPSRAGCPVAPESGPLFCTAITDLTERKRAEEGVRAGAERLKLAQSAGGVGTWECDSATGLLTWSAEKSEMLGVGTEPATVSYEYWLGLIHPEDRERIATELHPADLEEIDIEYRVVRPDGQVRWICTKGKRLSDELGAKMVGVTIDITESKEVQRRLEELNEALAQRTREAESSAQQLRALAAQLTQAENRERRRLALLLHDHLQQLLIALRMKVGMVKSQPKSDRAESLLAQSVALLDEAITASRSLSVELSPPMLYDSGLGAALHWLADQMKEKHGLDVRVHVIAEPEDEDIRVFLFQCVRELLFNAVKHARSPTAEVIMSKVGQEEIGITVRDFGRGFDPACLSQSRESFGLLSIRERLKWLGGRFDIRSMPGAGTEAILTAPMHKPQDESQAGMWVSEKPAGGRKKDLTASIAPKIKVLVVDDHEVVRQGLTCLLETQPDVKIVAQASDGSTAVDYARTLPVDIVIMDYSMPGMNGAEATRRIHDSKPDLPVIGMSVYEEASIAESMHQAGAAAFFRKDDPGERIIATVRSLWGRRRHVESGSQVPA